MGENIKKWRVKECRVLFIEFYLAVEIVPRIIKSIDFIYPEGFLVKGVKSQGEPDEKADKNDKYFLLS